jgi:hypothetical protein
MTFWPRTAERSSARLLRTNPVLLLSDAPDDASICRLLREWNPSAVLPEVAEGVRWTGPFRLGGILGEIRVGDATDVGDEADIGSAADVGGDTRAEAAGAASSGWTTAYVAQVLRSRTRVPDGPDANLLRLRYPHGIPTGAEAVAWSLIMGLARRFDGAGRLPAASLRGSRALTVAPQHPLVQENSYCVYGSDLLPWPTLRSVLCLSLPDLDRSVAPSGDDEHCYCLDSPGAFEVRVQPFRLGANGFVPYALRPTGAADRHLPGTVYRLRCLPQRTEQAAQRIDAQLRAAACLLADMLGGMLLDGDGFPLVGAMSAARR